MYHASLQVNVSCVIMKIYSHAEVGCGDKDVVELLTALPSCLLQTNLVKSVIQSVEIQRTTSKTSPIIINPSSTGLHCTCVNRFGFVTKNQSRV